ncbi:uncharacterized protein LOC6576982 [Drosophila mojavensis]|uniref:Cytochrome b561 domain-containing protein n=1 Tax=Drosophila mojavensis TaxID=7230 RepID=B4KIP4_DROMO|nr:uncharacterized protein LOC6576982 [Drosophila mojavensis]EDW12400.1 uncharacterized protein Dmoj_GI10180 [Drosophila mojavensis]
MATGVMSGCSATGLRDVCENPDLWAYVRTLKEHADGNVTNGRFLEGTQSQSFSFDISSAVFYFGFCALISHLLLAGVTAVIVHKCVSLKMVHTAGHAFYCTVGFVFFLGEALLVRHSGILVLWLGISNVDLLHSALGLLAFGIGVGGVGIKTLQKRERKREDPNATVRHFRSNHGFSGIVGCALLLCCVLSGLPLYFYTNKSLQLVHRFCSLASFATLMTSQMFSYNTGFARRQWKAHHVRLFKLFTFIALITTMNYEFRRFAREIVSLIMRQVWH